MPQQRVKRQKAITVAAVLVFFLAFITAIAFSTGYDGNDESLNIIIMFVLSTMIYFALIYPLVLITIGLFKDNNTETGSNP